MQALAVVVRVQPVFRTVEREARTGDPVGEASGGGAEKGRMGLVIVEMVETERQRRVVAIEVKRLNGRAARDDVCPQAAAFEEYPMNRLAGRQMPPYLHAACPSHDHSPSL